MSETDPIPSDPSARRRALVPAAWLVGGIVIGLAFAYGILREKGRTPQQDPIAQVALPAKIDPLSAKPDQPPSDVKADTPNPAEQTPPSATSNPPTNSANPARQAVQPPDALAGRIPSGPIPGSLQPVNPVVIGESPLQRQEAQAAYVEVMVIVPEADVAPTQARVASAVRESGGQLLGEFIHDPDFPEKGVDLMAAVPKDRAKALHAKILEMGSGQTTDEWTGPASERRSRMERHLREAVHALEARLRKLLIKYLDDAPEVVATKESLERHKAALRSMRTAPTGQEAIRVFVGKSPPALPGGAGNPAAK